MEITTLNPAAATAFEVRLQGRFDAHEAPAFRQTIDGTIGSGRADIRVNLSRVDFVDSAALAELVRGMKHCREQGGDLVIAQPSDPVRVILELTKLDAAFVID